MKKTDSELAEENAFERAVRAAKAQLAGKPATLDPKEQEMLKTFPSFFTPPALLCSRAV